MNTLETPLHGPESRRFVWLFKAILFVGFLILLTRLTELQIIKGEYFRTLSEDNRLRVVTITAPRGKIIARGGEILAENTEVLKTVTFNPTSGYTKSVATVDTPADEVLVEWDRSYPHAAVVSHLTGYLGEVDETEIGKPDPHCADRGLKFIGSLTGKNGLEYQYDCALRGIDGRELVEVDIQGKRIRTVGRQQPVSGKNLETTIDFGLQKKLSESFHDLVGAAVATDAHGQILAMYSNPSFDPTLFNQNNANADKLAALFLDKKLPLFNRAVSGGYHPGSIFKIIIGTAAFEDKKINQAYTYTDTGNIHVNGFDYSTWFFTKYGRAEGQIGFTKALARSTDTFFYNVGELVGIDRLDYWADQFGIGKKTNVDLPGEVSGLLPSPEWKLKTLGERWYLGNTFHFAIGQGDLLVTPLQANVLTSVVANGGQYCPPFLTFIRQKITNCQKMPISGNTLEELVTGMTMACEPGGTGAPFFQFEPKVACKTGTAETGDKTDSHAWFTVFAPVDNPQIVLTVLIENGGEGSVVAAPIAKEALEYWFHGRNP